MFALSNAIRVSPRAGSYSLASSLAPASRLFSSSSSCRADNFSGVSATLNQAAETKEKTGTKTLSYGQKRRIQVPEDTGPKIDVFSMTRKFISPFDYTKQARVPSYLPKKDPQLGPSAKDARALDIFHQMNIDPLHEAFNSTLLSAFVTEMGKVKPRAATKLTWKNQRRLGKAIRRAKMMGIIPVLSRRPLNKSSSVGPSQASENGGR
ncbi:hypothetical protein K474DRAFT_1669407 [Panus rudis PR-1116 ss-1]|nr:hypothetical protein K474DRAFT_1669407 [Panus rudis PR-1116 ss-1]